MNPKLISVENRFVTIGLNKCYKIREGEIEEIVRLFDEAEEKLKDIELLNSELPIPAINQLRYAGYHLARALCEKNSKEIDIQINKAKGHCKRAIYDTHEVGIIYLLEEIKSFGEKDTYFSHFIIEIIPNYPELLVVANKARSFIVKIQENHRNNRDSYYQECAPHYKKLSDIVNTLRASESLIDEKAIAYIEKDKKESRRFVITTLLTVLGVMLTALGITIAST